MKKEQQRVEKSLLASVSQQATFQTLIDQLASDEQADHIAVALDEVYPYNNIIERANEYIDGGYYGAVY